MAPIHHWSSYLVHQEDDDSDFNDSVYDGFDYDDGDELRQ